MHSRSSIRDLRRAEALQLREHIASLERELAQKASSSVSKVKLAEIGQQLRWHKVRLEILRECVAGMSNPDDARQPQSSRPPNGGSFEGRGR